MMLKFHVIFMAFFMLGGCAVIAPQNDQKSIEGWMATVFEACIDAQLSIASPLWDKETRQPKSGVLSDYVVEFSRIPKVPTYSVIVELINNYPDAPLSSCRLDKNTHEVLRVAYYLGESGAGQNKEIDLVKHDPLAGVDERELDKLIKQEATRSFSLTAFYESLN